MELILSDSTSNPSGELSLLAATQIGHMTRQLRKKQPIFFIYLSTYWVTVHFASPVRLFFMTPILGLLAHCFPCACVVAHVHHKHT